MAGEDAQSGPALPGLNPIAGGGGFEYPDGGGADSDHTASLLTRRIDRGRGSVVDTKPLAMDGVLRRVIDPDGPEGVDTNVERDERDADAAI